MVPSEQKSQDAMDDSCKNPNNYLERKYGKEPRISSKELKQIQWNWH
ncbi:MAG: hypothetical protein ACW98F_05485 [Candidatus Hodarchaeales archaeon]|jgi:hypothetical protein